jgi:hypothetical protein
MAQPMSNFSTDKTPCEAERNNDSKGFNRTIELGATEGQVITTGNDRRFFSIGDKLYFVHPKAVVSIRLIFRRNSGKAHAILGKTLSRWLEQTQAYCSDCLP